MLGLLATPPVCHQATARFDFGATGFERFAAWRGKSGRRYVVSVYAIADCPDYEHAVALAIRREADGGRHIVAAFDLGAVPLAVLRGAAFAAARRAGASEVHLHLLAGSGRERLRVLDDLAPSVAPVSRGERPARPAPGR
jgi:hypothetical protein